MVEVRPLARHEYSQAITLCQRSTAHNLILLSNLTQPPSDQALFAFWGQFSADGTLVGVLLRYHRLWFYYCEAPGHVGMFAPRIAAATEPTAVLNGPRGATLALAAEIPGYQLTLSLPGRLRLRPAAVKGEIAVSSGADLPIRRAAADDVAAIAAFYADAPADVRRGRDSVARSISGDRRTFVAEQHGEIVACALTTVELSALAMIGGLHASNAAAPALQTVLAELVRSLAADGKGACVVTRDPHVDAVCDRLGFDDAGQWQIVHLRCGAFGGMTAGG